MCSVEEIEFVQVGEVRLLFFELESYILSCLVLIELLYISACSLG